MKHINIPEYKAMATVSDDCPQEVIDALKALCKAAYNWTGKEEKKKDPGARNWARPKNKNGSDHKQYG